METEKPGRQVLTVIEFDQMELDNVIVESWSQKAVMALALVMILLGGLIACLPHT